MRTVTVFGAGVKLPLWRGLLLTGVLGCLIWQATRMDTSALQRALQGDVRGWCLAAGLALYIIAVLLTFVRWWLLARAIRVPLLLGQALRWGFVGYFMQFFSLGSVGGDVFKAVLIARGQPAHRLAGVASIAVDRMVGMLALLVFACGALTCSGKQGQLPPAFLPLTAAFAVAAIVGLAIFFLTLYTPWRLTDLNRRWLGNRRLWQFALRLDEGLGVYRTHRLTVLLAVVMGLVSHFLQATTLYFAARTIATQAPNLIQQLCIWPIAGMAGALPLTPAGLGTFDAAYTYLYNWFASPDPSIRIGLLVTMLFRIICLVTAGVGMTFYLTSRAATRSPET